MNIFDSTAIILFTETLGKYNCLSLLSKDTALILPESVYNEILESPNHNVDGFISQDVLKLEENMDPDCEDKIKDRNQGLGNGEINVISWGIKLKKSNKNVICVLDDKDARKAAKSYGLNIIGSIGLLIILKNNKLLDNTNLKDIINLIQNSSFHITNEILGSLLDE